MLRDVVAGEGVYTRFRKPELRRESPVTACSWMNFDAPVQVPPATMPIRSFSSGPLISAEAYVAPSSRTIGGARPSGVGEARDPPDPDTRRAVVHCAVGRFGCSVTTKPGLTE